MVFVPRPNNRFEWSLDLALQLVSNNKSIMWTKLGSDRGIPSFSNVFFSLLWYNWSWHITFNIFFSRRFNWSNHIWAHSASCNSTSINTHKEGILSSIGRIASIPYTKENGLHQLRHEQMYDIHVRKMGACRANLCMSPPSSKWYFLFSYWPLQLSHSSLDDIG